MTKNNPQPEWTEAQKALQVMNQKQAEAIKASDRKTKAYRKYLSAKTQAQREELQKKYYKAVAEASQRHAEWRQAKYNYLEKEGQR